MALSAISETTTDLTKSNPVDLKRIINLNSDRSNPTRGSGDLIHEGRKFPYPDYEDYRLATCSAPVVLSWGRRGRRKNSAATVPHGAIPSRPISRA